MAKDAGYIEFDDYIVRLRTASYRYERNALYCKAEGSNALFGTEVSPIDGENLNELIGKSWRFDAFDFNENNSPFKSTSIQIKHFSIDIDEMKLTCQSYFPDRNVLTLVVEGKGTDFESGLEGEFSVFMRCTVDES